ncbi:hypothetical protein OG205_10240 [Lentzea sp. NBC_00516]|uniref:hypothetical protein n=1 Tax=Lentzea sp. NBC_00516 TaxID=2903582 RepID=UPI002E81DDB5|nr:hypothetical protein [Lentzea sp. NBC_00516]WUD27352.1 hypothetical protein OG205_10240 [Lentzea sp. NBC_00516]
MRLLDVASGDFQVAVVPKMRHAGRVVDGGENVLALTGKCDRLDEVHRQDRLSLRAQEVGSVIGCTFDQLRAQMTI